MSLVRIARGSGTAVRGFDEYQVLEALRLMVRGPLGRPTLEREVGIGEASAKTLLRSLRGGGPRRAMRDSALRHGEGPCRC